MMSGMGEIFLNLFRRRKDPDSALDRREDQAAEAPDQSAVSLDRDALKGDLKQIGARIQETARASEQDFLLLGEKLQTLWQRASEIAEGGRRAADLMSGSEITDSIDRVIDILNRMDRYLDESSRRMEQNFSTFQVLLDSIYRAERPLAGLHRIVTGLQTLGISTRIESALISQRHQNFVFLADEVNIQSEKIKAHSDDLLEKMQSLAVDIKRTLEHLKQTHETHQGSGGTILANLRKSLASLVDNRNRASVSAERLSQQSEVESRSMGQVIMSMQFHDITRQQIEHVKSALDDLADREREDVIGKGCELQAAQVIHSQGELNTAVGGLQKNLSAIAESVRDMVDETAGLSGLHLDECTSSFGGLEHEMTSAASRLAEYRQAEQFFSQTLESFVQVLEGMKNFSRNIEIIGRSIKFVALNATIQAARIGREGAAMDVVAQGIRQLSSEAREQTDIISSSLEKIQEGANRLHDNALLAAGEEKSGLGDISEEIDRVMAGVCRQNDTVQQLLHDINDQGRRLADDTEALSRNITVHQKMNQSLGSAEQGIKKIGRLFLEAATADDAAHPDESLAGLTARYTMDSERLVHDGLFEPPSSQAEDGPAAETVMADKAPYAPKNHIDLFGDDLPSDPGEEAAGWDDNIDLFTDDIPAPGLDEANSGAGPTEPAESREKPREDAEDTEDDLGDNVELF